MPDLFLVLVCLEFACCVPNYAGTTQRWVTCGWTVKCHKTNKQRFLNCDSWQQGRMRAQRLQVKTSILQVNNLFVYWGLHIRCSSFSFSFFSQCPGVSAEEPAPGCCTLHDIWSNKDSLLLWLLPLLLSRHYSPNKWINLTLPLLLLVASRRKAEKIRLSLWQCFQQWNHLEMLRGG